MIVDCKVIQYHLNVCYVKNCSRLKNDPFRTISSHFFGKLHVYLLQQERCEIVPSWSRDLDNFEYLDQIILIKLSRSDYLDQIIWINWSGSDYLDQIVWIKYSRSNYLDQSIWINWCGSNYLDQIFISIFL